MSRTIFFAQLLVMLSAFVLFLATPTDFHTLGMMIYLLIITAVTMLYGVWQLFRNREPRKWGLGIVATPLVCLTTPFLIVSLNGGPVAPVKLVFAVLVLIGIVSFVLLSRTKQWQDGGSFISKRFNTGIVVALAGLLALYWAPIGTGLNMQDSLKLPGDIAESDKVLRVILIYFALIAGPALLLSLFTLLYAPVGLIKNAGVRLVHVVQLLLALVTLVSLAIGAFFAGIMLINPG